MVSAFLLVLLGAAFLRLRGVAVRSLWLDEFCTWHVSRLPLLESLRWGPELTIPPLYQFILRLMSADPHPPEELLRMPAVVAGVLTVAGGGWLGWMLAGRSTGLALALLLAFNVPQIEYSREARPYTLLVLLSVLSTACWFRLVTRASRGGVGLYVLTATAVVYAHYLSMLVILAHAAWWLAYLYGQRRAPRRWLPGIALLMTLVMCMPIVLRPIVCRESISQALEWLEPAGMGQRLRTLGQVTYGIPWVVAGLVPAIIIPALRHLPAKLWDQADCGPGASTSPDKQAARDRGRLAQHLESIAPGIGLLLMWLACSWVGLLGLSVVAGPLGVVRYALPAAVPALLLPLVVARAVHRVLPLVIAGLVVGLTSPRWIDFGTEVEPGFRELTKYIGENLDPSREAVVLVRDTASFPHWPEVDRLALAYYPIAGREVHELDARLEGALAEGSILRDPRALYLIVFRAEVESLVRAAGRRFTRIHVDGESFSRLLFAPYRLLRVAPLSEGNGAA